MIYELKPVIAPGDWEAWHEIRERVLWLARGDDSYDRNHSSLASQHHFPYLLVTDGDPVGAIAVEMEGSVAWLRRVAIREDAQRRGHGRAMVERAIVEGRRRGATVARSNVAADAVGFYDKLGFVVTKEIEGAGPQMSRSL
jgi:ribosomal protein S18 acetylase RimI-like enzyme